MDLVHLLPDSVANQIAAGEVIQRPSSCLKELVENSLDAGATHVQVLIRDAGRTLLQVVDNGKGMSSTDARMAFERHATSKIQQASDLYKLRTMGFRGEALASICAVAQVEMTTRRPEDELGTLVEINGSQLTKHEPIQCPVGTNFKVKNLFYNIPVRRKFLKTDQTELRNIINEFFRIVLVYPSIQFTLVNNDEILFELPVATLKQRIESVCGRSTKSLYTSNLVDIHSDTEVVSIHGYIGKPETAGKVSQQYFFVNGRFMRHPLFHKSVVTAYSGMLQGDVSPSYFIYFDINPEFIDVNIHPTKTEIKFADEQIIYPILLATVREALGKFNLVPSMDFTSPSPVDIPALSKGNETAVSKPTTVSSPSGSYNPFLSRKAVTPSWNTFYDSVRDMAQQQSDSQQESVSLFDVKEMLTSSPIQFADKYILTVVSEGVLLIHQHRAHANLLYTQYVQRLNDHNGNRQSLLFPEVWDIDGEDKELIESLLPDLENMGFELTCLTPYSYSIGSVPALLGDQNPILALQKALNVVRDTDSSIRQEIHHQLALSMAYSSAIPTGKRLTQEEMQSLVRSLFSTESYRVTPDGKTIISLLTKQQVEAMF